MTKLEQLHLFLKFYNAPQSGAKDMVWEDITHGAPFEEIEAEKLVSGLIDGSIGFDDGEISMMRGIAEPSRLVAGLTDRQWAERLAAIAEPADLQWQVIELLRALDFTTTADVWQSRA